MRLILPGRPGAGHPTRAAAASPGVTVLIDGPARSFDGLAAALPAGWSLRCAAAGPSSQGPGTDGTVLVVVADATAASVSAARARHPDAPVLAVVDCQSEPARVVEVLGAGASGCLRGAQPDAVTAHLVALDRRARVTFS